MTRSRRLLLGFGVAGAVMMVAACGGEGGSGGPTGPSPTQARAHLVHAATPNLVPMVATPICTPGAMSNWFWTNTISNTGSAPFAVASFVTTVNVPGVAPVVTTETAASFAAGFGTSTIAPGASVQAPACAGLPFLPAGEVTLSAVLTATSGETAILGPVRLSASRPSGSGSTTGFLRAIVDGTSWSSTQVAVVRGSAGITIIGEDAAARRITIELTEPLAVRGPGTWLTFRDRLIFRLNDGALRWATTGGLPIEGQVVFTTMTDGRAVGVFTFRAPAEPTSGAIGTKGVTDGVFDVSF
jgi:hypothetical protein